MAKLNSYSVLLLYPPSISEGTETYYDFVRAASPAKAVKIARSRAAKENQGIKPKDFETLLVTSGHIQGLDPEEN